MSGSKVGRIVGVGSNVKSQEFEATVICGPETAARLGVPVGTAVNLGRVAYHHRNPIKRWLGRRKISRGFDATRGGAL